MEQNVSASTTVKDPVCGMDVVPGRARSWDYLYQGTVYHFCGPDCRSRFQADPKGILGSKPGQMRAASGPRAGGERMAWWSGFSRLWRGK